MLPPLLQAALLLAGLGWICFRIFGPQTKDALPTDRKMRKKERVLLASGLVLFVAGIPATVYLDDLLRGFGLGVQFSFPLAAIFCFVGPALITWALVLNFKEYRSV